VVSILSFVEKLRAVQCAAHAVLTTERRRDVKSSFERPPDSIPGQKMDSFDVY
jgi:hypothetical protein